MAARQIREHGLADRRPRETALGLDASYTPIEETAVLLRQGPYDPLHMMGGLVKQIFEVTIYFLNKQGKVCAHVIVYLSV